MDSLAYQSIAPLACLQAISPERLVSIDGPMPMTTVQSVNELMMALRTRPSIRTILVDTRLRGFEEARHLSILKRDFPRVDVILMANGASQDQARRWLEQGVKGIVGGDFSNEQLSWVIGLIGAGQRYIAPDVMLADTHTLRVVSCGRSPTFTRRESQVARHVADGHSNKEIALALGLQEVTIKVHVSSILRKLDVRNRTEAAGRLLTLTAA